jgi:hypothetical protein
MYIISFLKMGRRIHSMDEEQKKIMDSVLSIMNADMKKSSIVPKKLEPLSNITSTVWNPSDMTEEEHRQYFEYRQEYWSNC